MIATVVDEISTWVWIAAGIVAIIAGCYGAVKWARAQFREAAVADNAPVIKAAILEAMAPILAELHPNGGSSLRDSIDRLEEGHEELKRANVAAEEWRRLADIQLRNIQQGQIGQ